ncbi:GNAT family N-acetyltransferase [Micromonospora sp. NPDC005553]|uniref:GNAT family N-acetyltransferase n=1 Tax=unclassified Micromonospora TaxID=2617518 RepID=UPI0033BBC2FE
MTPENDRYVVRSGRASDAVELARLHASVQLQAVTGGRPHPGIAAWVEDLLDGHPSVVPDDFLVAEYALANDGAPTVPARLLPAIAPDRSDGLAVRTATVADADALARIDRRLAGGDVLLCPRDAAVWRYEIAGRRPADLARREVTVLVQGVDVTGYLVHGSRLSAAGELNVFAAATGRSADWPQAAVAMYTHLAQVGRRYEASAPGPFTAVRPILGPEHPLVRLGPAGVPRRPRGWYVRSSDPADLVARLRPLLQARWQAADLQWREPTMTIDMYGRAARLEFTDGRLSGVTVLRGAISPSTEPGTHAAIPPGALLQLALGHRTLPEVLDAWPDCLLRDRRTEDFLTTAFPRVPVQVWPRN